MDELKSAFEKAMEKVEKLEKATPQELRRMEYMPRGNALAAKYLQEGGDLQAALKQHGPEVRGYLVEGIEEVLIRNIALPQNDTSKKTSARAMEGMLLLKKDKARVRNVFSKIEQLFAYYEQSRQQTYAQYKKSFEMKLEEARRAVEQQTGMRASIKAETHPQFQEEWRRVLAQLNSQHEQALAEQKQELKAIA